MRTRIIADLIVMALLGLGSDMLRGSPAKAAQTQSGDRHAVTAPADLPTEVQAKLAKLHAAVSAARDKHNALAEAASLLAQGDMQMQASSYGEALESYTSALKIAQAGNLREQEAAALNGQANYFRTMSDNARALELFTKALDLATAADDSRNQAVALNGMGWVKVNAGQHDQGLELHSKALALAEKINDPDLEASVLNRLGTLKDIQGQNDAALSYFQRALAKWREASDEDGAGKAVNNIAILYMEAGDNAKALTFYNQALKLYHAAGDRAGETGVLSNIGVVYKRTGEEQRAIECYERVLPLQRALGNRAGEAVALNNLGNAYSALGRNQQALEFFNQSLAIRRGMNDAAGEAGALENMGELWVILGDMQKGLDILQEALKQWKAADQKRGEAGTLNAIGIVYDDLGKPEMALNYYLDALDLYKLVNDPDGQATVANNFAGLLNAPGQKEKALKYYQIALDIERALHNRDSEARTLNNMGLVYEDLKQPDKARNSYEQALAIWREIGDRNGEAQVLDNLGSLTDDSGEKEKARQYFAEALPLAKSVSNPLREAELFHHMMLNEKERQPLLAVFYGKQAVNLVQHARGQIRAMDRDLQRSFLATKTEYYHDLAEVLITQGRLPEAQQVLDFLKDQEYADYVRGEADKSLSPLSLTPAEQQARDDYDKSTAQIVSLGEEWMRLKRLPSRTPEQDSRYQQLSERLNDASRGLNDFYARLYTTFSGASEANKELADIKGSVSQLKQFIAKEPHTVALYTLVGKERYSVIVITGAASVAREYPITAIELNKKIAQFQQALRESTADGKAPAAELYKILIGPVASDLEQVHAETLVWALDGVLRYVPIGALYDGSKYVVERYNTVAITPASIPHLADAPDVSNLTAVGMGISQKFETGLPPLPSVAAELEQVIQSSKSTDSHGALPGTILLNGDFTEKAMENLLDRQVAVVHIASHFVFKPGDDSQSYLLLAGKDQDKAGFHLTVADFRDDQRISLEDTQLLTLSACETGMSGTAGNGREIDGLGTTAQLKGAKAVISSLWEVNDASTGVLMADFYRRWVNGGGKVTKAEALREAQLDLLQGRLASQAGAQNRGINADDKEPSAASGPADYSHPYYWAPFVLMGNWH
ncbi:MAG TPA: tetratricopeptide repeat protein [Terracidiphilus sp.]|jgi:CHAT domain-containing protein/Tfp pilus assembly protein PilF